ACNFAAASTAAENGLDKRLIAAATAQGLPVQGLEPFDTIFGIFDQFTTADQLVMLTQTLDSDGASNDMSQTLTDAYFAGDARLFWQFSYQQSLLLPGMTKAEADREFALVETALMDTRNAAWIPVIKSAAAKGPIVVAFGALHLSGDKGVLNLLRRDGYQITPISVQ
ncbi:MAG: TraB/GumN family protein, partial [Paracoccaceae bacterium]